jgi:hypothetical protein
VGRQRALRQITIASLTTLTLTVLAACSKDSPSSTALPSATGAPPTTTAVTTAPPSSAPSTGPGGVAVPTPAPEAAQRSDTGAKAFGVYYVKLLDYTYATRDVAPLRQASDAACRVCQGTADDVSKFAKPGYKFEGGRFTLKDLTVSQPSPTQPVIVANISITGLTVTDPNGQRDPYSEAAHPRAQLMITEKWTGSGWTVTDLKVGT